jgi:predicted AAA+ superfamily ATPase
MTLKQPGYRPRLIDTTIERYGRIFGALSIEGPKWCGKTWTALNHANSVVYLLNPENNYANREAARLNPASVLEGIPPLLVDEWQEVPAIWDAVRFQVDKSKAKCEFILTGSVTPKKKQYSHSGAGRIARIRMRSMSLFESNESSGEVSLKELFEKDCFAPAASTLNQDVLLKILVRGGWPENIAVAEEDAGIIPQQYIEALLVGENNSETGEERFNPQVMRQVLAALARVNTTTASDSRIVADVQARYGSITRQTVAKYLSALEQVFLFDEIPQWFPELRSTIRLRKSPKRVLTDPSLAVAAMRATPSELKRDPRTLGMLFENLCLRDLAIYAESFGASLSHYHDDSGLEVDAILEIGTEWAALEIKLGAHRVEEAADGLNRLTSKLTQRGASSPRFLAILTGGGPLYTRDDGIHVIPLDCLRD